MSSKNVIQLHTFIHTYNQLRYRCSSMFQLPAVSLTAFNGNMCMCLRIKECIYIFSAHGNKGMRSFANRTNNICHFQEPRQTLQMCAVISPSANWVNICKSNQFNFNQRRLRTFSTCGINAGVWQQVVWIEHYVLHRTVFDLISVALELEANGL